MSKHAEWKAELKFNSNSLMRRWRHCLTRTTSFFSSIIISKYINVNVEDLESFQENVRIALPGLILLRLWYFFNTEVFDCVTLKQVSAIVNSVQLVFYEMIEEFTWIASNETRNLITNELEDLRFVSGFASDIINNSTNVTEYYSGVSIKVLPFSRKTV
jgi:hypothetical protein